MQIRGVVTVPELKAEEFVPYVPVERYARENLDRLDHPGVRSAVLGVMQEVLATEGPVPVDRLAKLVANTFALSRVRQNRVDDIVRLVPRGWIRGDRSLGTFVWPEGVDPGTWAIFRRTPVGVSRQVEDVTPEEIGNIVAALAELSMGIDREEAVREVAGVLGLSRVSAGTRTHVTRSIDVAVGSGRLVESEGVLAKGQGAA